MIPYIIKSILCSGLFMLAYKALLEKERMHRFNRLYLLTSLVLAFVIPLISFSTVAPGLPVIENAFTTTTILTDIGSVQQKPLPAGNGNYISATAFAIYGVITTLLLFRFILNLKTIFIKIRNNPTVKNKNSTIVLITEDLTPHSFLNYIFINREDYNHGLIEQEVLVHESTHVQQKHSFDILFIEAVQLTFWLNPFIFLYKKALQLNHEFLADEAVINTCADAAAYQYLLIEKANKQSSPGLTSQFNYSITKKRLIMMTRTKSFRNALCRQIAIIPILVISIFIFSTKTIAQESSVTLVPKQVPSTQEGVSQELLNEYAQIVNKYTTMSSKGYPIYGRFPDVDISRLETIFLLMSKAQQAKQIVVFIPTAPPLPRVVPTKEQVASWKNAKIYGVWINEKRVSNTQLNNYSNTDFAQVFVSKLGKNTVNYGKHYYQVDLMTTEHYNLYYKQTIESKKKYQMGIKMPPEKLQTNDKGKLSYVLHY
jgi:beta-lactamase regulating signal transducer with metallopeptidase domain